MCNKIDVRWRYVSTYYLDTVHTSFVSVKINFHVRVFFSLFIIVLLFIVLDFIYIGNLFSIFYNANLP